MSRVYVGNLSPRVTERDLEDEFRAFGVIRSVWVARRPPGYAFIDFDDSRDAEDAIRELDGMRRSYSPRGRSPRRRSVSPRGRSFSRSPPPPYRGREEVPYANGNLCPALITVYGYIAYSFMHFRHAAMASGIGDEAEVEGCVSSGSALHCFIASALPCGFVLHCPALGSSI
ncbi:hypothetical protein G4B88_024404 [Cannabis sativa]|uniref:RRM domain-containing protein n=1 Tax=Cannabis sativa TaxID=3483 RepID=A0A7J6H713_CANSA|nr:hypothetical protein G4B88_024404 [Cannabis sativa]